jgi:hypothetical protein
MENHMTIRRLSLGLVALLVIVAGAAHAVSVNVYLTPDQQMVEVGETLNVIVWVGMVEDLMHYDITVGFDPSKLDYVSASPGVFLTPYHEFYDTPGQGSVLVGMTREGTTGASPGGILFELEFLAVTTGISPIDLVSITLLDSAGIPISVASVYNQDVHVTAPNPEPGTVTLCMAASAVFGFRFLARRQKRRGKART